LKTSREYHQGCFVKWSKSFAFWYSLRHALPPFPFSLPRANLQHTPAFRLRTDPGLIRSPFRWSLPGPLAAVPTPRVQVPDEGGADRRDPTPAPRSRDQAPASEGQFMESFNRTQFSYRCETLSPYFPPGSCDPPGSWGSREVVGGPVRPKLSPPAKLSGVLSGRSCPLGFRVNSPVGSCRGVLCETPARL